MKIPFKKKIFKPLILMFGFLFLIWAQKDANGTDKDNYIGWVESEAARIVLVAI